MRRSFGVGLLLLCYLLVSAAVRTRDRSAQEVVGWFPQSRSIVGIDVRDDEMVVVLSSGSIFVRRAGMKGMRRVGSVWDSTFAGIYEDR